MNTRIKIRGIYSTALTRLVLDGGYRVVEPSAKIRERFGVEVADEPFDIQIQDRDDQQGIILFGGPEKVSQFLPFLQNHLMDAAVLELGPMENDERMLRVNLELPGASKGALDELRLTVTSTLTRHHRLRAIDARALEQAETYLMKHPDKRDSIEEKLFLEVIMLPLEKSGLVSVQHLKPSGRPIRPREGVLMQTDDRQVIFKRMFSHGRYDGLDVDIQPGDYGITEVREGAWHMKHAYYSKDSELIGEYHNINTPIELYPWGARYLDLEVDVIRRAGGEPFIVDEEKLSLLSRQGNIGGALAKKAMETAEELMRKLHN